MKKRRARLNISETHFSSDLIAIKGIPSLYFSCLRFLYLTVGWIYDHGRYSLSLYYSALFLFV